ncbi:N-acetylglucosamine-1-phosphate, putative [Theileria equi strain WA]|uniref:UDP-N-acetylglucosamine--dolichyl-phosphate N-acetylglucosaminephosphotransferase n=1 Tax=Theileria equi strain WA TaxID=1537102 RepID=L0AZS4_THEEQ|nr:N-acetylglucosamine-1-phosphate, putative [Theileria equi strain WA]AFZ80501.1 N-acetylglucosamine-1-phosphate, putative [Theileria equi strain WA]|eukprot:XP_004830167.1 N-acetylglucosamine-1-phosphate, putative [Theileria equi strain WA]
MQLSTKEQSSLIYKPSLNFFKLFSLIFGISSGIATTTLIFCNGDTKHFVLLQVFCVIIAFINHFGTLQVSELLENRGLISSNLNRDSTHRKIPEPGALLGCALYIICMICVQLVHKGQCEELLKYNAGLVSITLMTLLGFIDDVLLLNWWSKIITPILASLPLCLAHSESTVVKLPSILPVFGSLELDIGYVYYIYMIFLTVFCANSINIYAGINGLEIGQSLVMAFFVLIYNSIHRFSFYLTLPFIAINISLLCYNWYPAVLFVGNTYSLFAGTYFSVISILGNFSKIMPFIFIPQLINFILSLPQLFGIVPCPRHRIPRYNQKTDRLEYSRNLTLINLFLWVFGPMKEEMLSFSLIVFQTFCCTLGLILKYSAN